MWKHYFEELFSFSPSQFRGILILLILIVAATIFKKYIESRPAFSEEELTAFRQRVDSFERTYQPIVIDSETEEPDSQYNPIRPSPEKAAQLSDFNPDTFTADDWKKTGVPDYIIARILHYEEKGGRFRSADDLKKIYGFPNELFQKLQPYIKISSGHSDSVTNQKQEIVSIELNTADTIALKRLPGIGSKLAARIVKYRQKLGGFYSISQLTEVYGISPEVFAKIRSKLFVSSPVHVLLINKLPYDSIVQHPYLKMLASKIIRCKKQNGDFQTLDELKSCAGINDSVLQKISPYISLQ